MGSVHGFASVDRLARIYVLQLCTDTGCSLEDLLEGMSYRDGELESERECPKNICCQQDLIILMISYLKPCDSMQRNDYY